MVKIVFVWLLVAASAPLNSNDILIVSGGVVSPDRPFAVWTQENHQTFADAMGYRYEAHFVNASETDSTVKPYWHKIYVMLNKLAERNIFGKVKNKVVVWIDDDGVFVRMDDMIERYLKYYAHNNIIIAKDADGHAYVNSGILIVRNSDDVFQFFSNNDAVQFLQEALYRGKLTRKVVQDSPTFKPELQTHERWLMKCTQSYECLHEQQAMKELLLGKQEHCVPDWEGWNERRCWDKPIETSRNWSKIVAVVPQRDKRNGLNMNTYSRDLVNTVGDILSAATDDFFVQATGLKPKIRCEHIQQLMALSSIVKSHRKGGNDF